MTDDMTAIYLHNHPLFITYNCKCPLFIINYHYFITNAHYAIVPSYRGPGEGRYLDRFLHSFTLQAKYALWVQEQDGEGRAVRGVCTHPRRPLYPLRRIQARLHGQTRAEAQHACQESTIKQLVASVVGSWWHAALKTNEFANSSRRNNLTP